MELKMCSNNDTNIKNAFNNSNLPKRNNLTYLT